MTLRTLAPRLSLCVGPFLESPLRLCDHRACTPFRGHRAPLCRELLVQAAEDVRGQQKQLCPQEHLHLWLKWPVIKGSGSRELLDVGVSVPVNCETMFIPFLSCFLSHPGGSCLTVSVLKCLEHDKVHMKYVYLILNVTQ